MIFATAEAGISQPDSSLPAMILAVGLALAHLLAGQLRFLHVIPRSQWLSLAGGASVAYVFVHIFPELSQEQHAIEKQTEFLVGFLKHHVYLVALLGFVTFYGLEKFAKTSRQLNQKAGIGDSTSTKVFWVHIGAFAVYNALIGYLLVHREDQGFLSLGFFFMAMALHFTVNDVGLRDHHKREYDKIGRWLLVGSVILGWVIGRATEIPDAVVGILFALLAGSIILNVLKEELPEERESNFWAFILGAGAYSILLLSL